MTNPNHTETSRSGDLVERLRSHDYDHAYNLKTDEELYAERDEAADRIEALEAEIERLREALEKIVDPVELEGFTDYQRMQAAATHILWHRDIARAALETKHD